MVFALFNYTKLQEIKEILRDTQNAFNDLSIIR